MNNRINITVPVTYTKSDEEQTRYQRVGVMFINERDNGDPVYSIRLDYPVGVTELVGFTAKERDDDDTTANAK